MRTDPVTREDPVLRDAASVVNEETGDDLTRASPTFLHLHETSRRSRIRAPAFASTAHDHAAAPPAADIPSALTSRPAPRPSSDEHLTPTERERSTYTSEPNCSAATETDSASCLSIRSP